MDKNLGLEIKDEKERLEFLKTNCFGVEEKGYMKQFSPDELAVMKDELADVSIEINEIEIRKKETIDCFKLELKPLDETRKGLLSNIKQKAEFVKENCYKFIYEDERMVGYFNAGGQLIEARPMQPEEMQKTMFIPMPKTGTND